MMYNTILEQKENLLAEIELLHQRHELSKSVSDDYFEPGMMEYLEQSEGMYNSQTEELQICFEVKGTRYNGSTEQIEKLKLGDSVQVIRDSENPYNFNNFMICTVKGKILGNMPAGLCNVIAPLFDSGNLVFTGSEASFIEPISMRSRHAKQAVLFVELNMKFL